MSEMKKRNIIIGSLSAIVLLMIVGYAAFSTSLNIKGTSNISSNWNVKISGVTTKNITGTATNNSDPTFTDTSVTFKTDLKSPGDSLEYEVTVTNAGTLNAKLDKITLSDTNNPAIKFTSSGLTEGDVINAGSTGTLLVKVEFLSSVTSNPSSKTSNLTVTLDYSQATSGGNTPSGESAADKLIATAVTTGDGLYADTYENGRYVYKGSNPNNYITFNGEKAGWRILGVETDGTLKIMRNSSLVDMAWDTGDEITGRNNINNTYCQASVFYDEYNGCNVWAAVDGTFTSGDISGTVTQDSSIKVYLNNDYYNTLSNEAKSQITSHKFAIGFLPSDIQNYNLESQIALENSNFWTGNVGLITLSDYLRANTNIVQCGSVSLNFNSPSICLNTNYLSNSTTYWTMTASSYDPSRVFEIASDGRTFNIPAFYSNKGGGEGTRPVLYLKSNITLSGEGTNSNPYTIN